MKKSLKIVGWTLGSLLALIVVAVAVLTLVFDPNQYKDEIAQVVKKNTGRDLKIPGKLGWTLYPRLGISAGAVTLANARGFGADPFAHVDGATVGVQVMPLLRGRIDVDSIAINGLVLNLAKNADGSTNWDDLTKTGSAEKTPAPKKPGTGAPSLAALSVGRIDVRNATLTWNDRTTGERYAIHRMTLTTGQLSVGKPIDIRLGFDLEYGAPAKRAPVALGAQAVYSTDILKMNSFELRIDDSRAKGSFEIRNFASPAYRFDLALDQFDLDRYLPPAPKTDTPAKPSAPAKPMVLPLGPLRSLVLQGKLSIGKLKAFGIRSEDIRTQIGAQQGAIHIGPSSAKLYGGSYRGDILLDVRGKTPQLRLDEKLERIGLGPFLKDAAIFDHFSGNANIALNVTASGGDAEAIKRTLDGKLSVSVNDGAIDGIDLVKMETQIKEARKQAGDDLQKLLAALPQLKPAKTDKTSFSKLGASATLDDGIVSNNDLAIEGPHLHVAGKGKINLPADRYENYELRLSDVPLKINGPLAAPSIRPDWNAIAKNAVKEKVEKKKDELKDRLEKKLKKKLGG